MQVVREKRVESSCQVSASEAKPLGECIDAALGYLERCQSEGGSWKGDYGGPMFLLPSYVATAHAVGLEIDPRTRADMVRYLRAQQNVDGGWGLHIEGDSHVFTSVLSYVALRLLGVDADDPCPRRARRWFLARGGPKASASWGKFVLAVLNLYDYEGLHPVPPELWLLPERLPVHPSRLWCHARMVYLPMSYLYGIRAQIPVDEKIARLRQEIYDEPYDQIRWRDCRGLVSPTDAYVPQSRLSRLTNGALGLVEQGHSPWLRRRALSYVLDHVRSEDINTSYLCIGPVNKLYNTLVWHFVDPAGPELRKHVERLPDYLWKAADGTKMQGYNSSELWDTALAIQAVVASGRGRARATLLERAHRFLEQNQVLEDVAEHARFHRHSSRGGWPFSTREHGWPISDCTAEGLKAALLLEHTVAEPIEPPRLKDAAELILSLQNTDGGWATYELTRGPSWLELLNPSDCFADIMIDYSYVECTSACVQALAAHRARYPELHREAISAAITRGRDFIIEVQRDDGSWEGSWGICFTYGAWFGIWGLRAAGVGQSEPAITAAVDFLLSKQLPDGGWGETPESCRQRRYVHAERGQAVMTAWAVLALAAAGQSDSEAVARAVAFLRRRQRPDGSWPAEHIAGMFNKTSAIHYDNYLKLFPLWALSLVEQQQ